MGNFIVSARKYRPSTFKTIVGQDSITTTLKNAVKSNQVAQAFLFCGPRGVGKTTCARVLAKTINCQALTEEGEACNQCESCRSFNQSASFNFFELDAASNSGVDDMRNLVEQVRILPQGATYKVYIIDEVHMLSSAAFNAFLKTLEEPPPYVKFILATTEKHKIIPTILSRCQIFDFKRITTNDIVHHLEYVAHEEGVTFEKAAFEIIAQKADGSLRDALSIFDQAVNFSNGNISYDTIIENLNIIDFKYFFKMIKALNDGDLADVLIQFNDIIEKGFDGLRFIESISEHIRNLMICKLGVNDLLETGDNISLQYIEQAKQVETSVLLEYLDIFNRCSTTYKSSNNKRLHVELALMMCVKKKIKASNPTKELKTNNTFQATENKPLKTEIPPLTANESKTSFKRTVKQEVTPIQTTNIKSLLEKEKQPTNTESTENKDNKDTTHEINYEVNEPKVEEAEENCVCITQDPIELITENWKTYVENATPNSYAARMLLNNQPPVIKEDKLYFEVANSIAEKEIKNVMPALLRIISTETDINFTYNIAINSEIKTHTTIIDPDEKFKKMAESNNNLFTLKQNLNLNIF
ncbi:MAG TPA: DNA polymerase III subunit gamma/tau [Bacteroidales bacterium]|nr:DNA polymerase III subunit gamma/tau [Bacteroidales bacterium]